MKSEYGGKGFVKEMNFKSGVEGRGSDRLDGEIEGARL